VTSCAAGRHSGTLRPSWKGETLGRGSSRRWWAAGAQDTFRRVWARILERAELRYRKSHTLRHTYASLLIQAGEPPTYVQLQLGHHSAAFTLAVYAHFVPRGDRRAVDALDDRAPAMDPAERAQVLHARGAQVGCAEVA